MSPIEVGTAIREWRERAGLTQDGLGDLLRVDADVIDQWEWGEARPDTNQAGILADILGAPPNKFSPEEIMVDLRPTEPAPSMASVGFAVELIPAASMIDVLPAKATETKTKISTAGDGPLQRLLKRSWVIPVIFVIALGGLAVGVATSVDLGLGAAAPTTIPDGNPSPGVVPANPTAVATLQAVVDQLQVRQGELTEQVGDLETQLIAEPARADQAQADLAAAPTAPTIDSTELDRLQADFDRLLEENELLRKAIVFSSAGSDIEQVALTFNDGGSQASTTFVLDTLAAKGSAATFFPTGQSVAAFPDLLEAGGRRRSRVGQPNVGACGRDRPGRRRLGGRTRRMAGCGDRRRRGRIRSTVVQTALHGRFL